MTPLDLPVGSQTWPHRKMIAEGRFAELLDTLKGLGVGAIELCSPFGYPEFASLADGAAVKRMVEDHGLTCTSTHVVMREMRQHQQQCIEWAQAAGITEMYVATLGGGATPTLDEVARLADEYNAIAAVAAAAGIQQGLHNEGFELSRVGGNASSGVEAPRTYDLLLERLDPQLVTFQFQMSAAARGFVAADYFTRYPGRFASMHVQDVDVQATTADRVVQAPVGKGMIDWPGTFRAARAAGVRSYYVEQSMELTRESVAALAAMGV
jgi:sugar phosphate isomerase/epimerase